MIARCLLIAALLSGVPAAWACSCAPNGGPGAETKAVQAVFFGRPVLISTEEREPWSFFGQDLTYSFSKPWVIKGADGPLSVSTSSQGSACGRPLSPGRLYLIYAHEHDGKLSISLCSRTRPWYLAAPDVLYLITRISLNDWQFLLVVVVLIPGAGLWLKRRRTK